MFEQYIIMELTKNLLWGHTTCHNFVAISDGEYGYALVRVEAFSIHLVIL